MALVDADLRDQMKKELETLPPACWREVLDFVRFLKHRPERLAVKTLPASDLDRLTGLVDWGGDALVDSERLYDDCS